MYPPSLSPKSPLFSSVISDHDPSMSFQLPAPVCSFTKKQTRTRNLAGGKAEIWHLGTRARDDPGIYGSRYRKSFKNQTITQICIYIYNYIYTHNHIYIYMYIHWRIYTNYSNH